MPLKDDFGFLVGFSQSVGLKKNPISTFSLPARRLVFYGGFWRMPMVSSSYLILRRLMHSYGSVFKRKLGDQYSSLWYGAYGSGVIRLSSMVRSPITWKFFPPSLLF